ncbi:SycD/LcrH family type III secretion system chaperone [Stenotrophomonas sp. NPDC077659]|uniref:SycD/LcrH family type III secretion system chaperone n=1 Tax=Stenotrophomonas sp. NPDC077659 TaxID=3390694 RepID=UPI003D07D820
MNEAPPGPGADQDTAEQTRLIIEGLRNGATLKDLKGISDDMLEGVYALAYDFFRNGQLDDAEHFFRFLSLYDFYNADYAMGLAAVLQMKKQYDKAISHYALAQMLDTRSDTPLFHMAQCHLALGKLRLARECFEGVARRAAGSELGHRAQAYLDAIGSVAETDDAAGDVPAGTSD